jgi:O-methyltransferase
MALAIHRIEVERISGDFAELGVFQGETSKVIHDLEPNRRLFLFDTFEGFPDGFTKEWEPHWSAFKDTSVEAIMKKIGNTSNVFVKKGIFPATTAGLENNTFSFVFLDADIYESTIEGLRFFYPRMPTGGYFFIHDFNSDWIGVSKAIAEFLDDKPERAIELPDVNGSVMFRKVDNGVNT